MLTVTIKLLDRSDQWVDGRCLKSWTSRLFRIREVSTLALNLEADYETWGQSDESLRSAGLKDDASDLTLVVVPFPLEGDFYARMLEPTLWVFSLHEMLEIMAAKRIPAENYILRNLYELWLILQRKCPLGHGQWTSVPHNAVRGCLLDMSWIKPNITYSLVNPILCGRCRADSLQDGVSTEDIGLLAKELTRMKRPVFDAIGRYVQRHPIWTIVITSAWSVLLGAAPSVLDSLFRLVQKNLP